MKKLLFVFPIVVLLAAGCNSSQQTSNPAPVSQDTNSTTTPTSTTQSASAESDPFNSQTTNTATYQQELKADPNLPIKLRDGKRLSDIDTLKGQLELYYLYSDNHQYPATLNDLLSNKAVVISAIPTAPEPADGSCSEQQNSYHYTRTSPTTFTLTFCLGLESDGLAAGVHTETQNHPQMQ